MAVGHVLLLAALATPFTFRYHLSAPKYPIFSEIYYLQSTTVVSSVVSIDIYIYIYNNMSMAQYDKLPDKDNSQW